MISMDSDVGEMRCFVRYAVPFRWTSFGRFDLHVGHNVEKFVFATDVSRQARTY